MNEVDSSRIVSFFDSLGYDQTSTWQEADLLLLNSCSVRQASEDKVYGWANKVRVLRKTKPHLRVILAGCLVGSATGERQRIDLASLKQRTPWVDEYWPPGKVGFDTPAQKPLSGPALIPISSGCNHFCSYCVVPFAREAEKSRPGEEIMCEVKSLVARGVSEVTLLGQNVNTYGKDLCPNCVGNPFVDLLGKLHDIKGLKKISFMTSHPKDMSEALIKALSWPKVEKYLHLPAQSGDDEILSKMNRGYTAAHYLDLVGKIRRQVPEIRLGTDVIVGFPTETEAQFQNTVKLFEKIKFDVAFVLIYSPREGTAAAKMEDSVPLAEKKRRHAVLTKLLKEQ